MSAVVIENITYTYPGNHAPDIADLSLSVQSGEIFGVIGRSGAGKSTLMRCLNGLNIPHSGSIRFLDKSFGMVFQHYNLLSSRTVFGNIALPLECQGWSTTKIQARVKELLVWMDLSDKAAHFPRELSGGQKQRVAIARALACSPKLLLCDEATAALDPETTRDILALIARLRDELGLTVIIISHELDVVKSLCDRIAIMEKGGIVEVGATLSILTAPASQAGRRLVAQNYPLPDSVSQRLTPESSENTHHLFRLLFLGVSHTQPIIANIAHRFDPTLSILQGDIQSIQNQAVGHLLIESSASEPLLTQMLRALEAGSVHVERVGYVTPS